MTEIATKEDFEAIRKELSDIKFLLSVANVKLPQVVLVRDICKSENVSKTQIYGKQRYLLPNCGVSDFPDGSARWNLSTYMKWRDIPLEQRKAMMFQSLEHLRKQNLKKESRKINEIPAQR